MIGEKLKQLRILRGLSQRDLASRCAVTHTAISLIEKNKTSPSINTLSALLCALGESFPSFFQSDETLCVSQLSLPESAALAAPVSLFGLPSVSAQILTLGQGQSQVLDFAESPSWLFIFSGRCFVFQMGSHACFESGQGRYFNQSSRIEADETTVLQILSHSAVNSSF